MRVVCEGLGVDREDLRKKKAEGEMGKQEAEGLCKTKTAVSVFLL